MVLWNKNDILSLKKKDSGTITLSSLVTFLIWDEYGGAHAKYNGLKLTDLLKREM